MSRDLATRPARVAVTAAASADAPKPARPRRDQGLALAERFGLPLLFTVIVVYFSLAQSEFPAAANWQLIFSSQAVSAVIALALLIPLLTGHFDISAGAIAISSSILAAQLMKGGTPLVLACLAAIGFGLLIGVINGLLVTRGGVNSLIATLGTGTILGGLVQWYSNNLSVLEISASLRNFGSQNVIGIPKLAILALVIAVIVAYVQTQTPFGRKLTAIGSNASAARLVGVRVERLTMAAFVASGAIGGVAGIMLLAKLGASNPSLNGIGVLLPALAAVYLGASTLFPGQFNVPGTILGLLLVAVLVSGLTLSGAQPWITPVAQGGSLLAAVAASAAFARRRQKGRAE